MCITFLKREEFGFYKPFAEGENKSIIRDGRRIVKAMYIYILYVCRFIIIYYSVDRTANALRESSSLVHIVYRVRRHQ